MIDSLLGWCGPPVRGRQRQRAAWLWVLIGLVKQRQGAHSAETSAIAARAELSSTIAFLVANAAINEDTARLFLSGLDTQPYLNFAALLTVYLVLGNLYESLVHPITILSTLPSAGVVALLALMLFNTEFSLIALIGVILLIGIVKKNAIMMIDFALEAEKEHGKSPVEAIHEACLLRFRPIMMTTMAALLGGVPLALGTGPGAELRRPLGVTIVGGLPLSPVSLGPEGLRTGPGTDKTCGGPGP